MKPFTRRLIAEALFYDEEYGALGTLSLVDPEALKERFLGSYLPEEDSFLVEEALEWEEGDDDSDVGYALAVDTKDYGRYDTPAKAAAALLELASEGNLFPSLTILFEEEGV